MQSSAGVEVPGLTIKPMAGMQEAEAIMQRGKAARASSGPEGATRSHLVLTIYVTCTHRSTGEQHAPSQPIRVLCPG